MHASGTGCHFNLCSKPVFRKRKETNKQKRKKEIFVTHLITFSNYINIFFFTGNIATKKYSE